MKDAFNRFAEVLQSKHIGTAERVDSKTIRIYPINHKVLDEILGELRMECPKYSGECPVFLDKSFTLDNGLQSYLLTIRTPLKKFDPEVYERAVKQCIQHFHPITENYLAKHPNRGKP